MNFASDNTAPASEKILAALIEANRASASAYGADELTKAAEKKLAEIFEHEVQVFLVSTGTAANALALAALCPPWGAVFAHKDAHIGHDECGAPEFFTGGAKLVGVDGENGKIVPQNLLEAIGALPVGFIHNVQGAALSLSQATEAGTVYSLREIAELTGIAHAHNLATHMDGARFANALVHLKATPAEMTWKAGIDVVSFGASKNGALACEAVVFFKAEHAKNFGYLRKRAGHTVSKGRLLGAQMTAYLDQGHWLDLAAHANAMTKLLSDGLKALPNVRFVWPVEANEVFAILPRDLALRLQAQGAIFYEWPRHTLPPEQRPAEHEYLARLICSFATTRAEIDQFIALAGH